jgi:hypothetical protein
MMLYLSITGLLLSGILIYRRDNRIHVETHNGRKYLVKQSENAQKSADLIALLENHKNALCNFLQSKKEYRNNTDVKRLLKNRKVVIEEIAKKYSGEAAYSINKGERIGICIKDKKGNFENFNNMFFVLMHELAHIMSEDYGHHETFWKNFSLLISNAIESKLYKNVRYKDNPQQFCGHTISHNPYDK